MTDPYTGTVVYASDACCSCGGGTITQGTPATPDSYVYDWVLNADDQDDNCQSNVHDCDGVCDGPGSTATAGTLEQGTFSLSISYADGNTQEEVYALSASGSNWSISCLLYTSPSPRDS